MIVLAVDHQQRLGDCAEDAGAVISAPVSFILIGVGGVALGAAAIAPVGIAVITAYLAISTVKYFKAAQDAM